jgi:hypothetical protein
MDEEVQEVLQQLPIHTLAWQPYWLLNGTELKAQG